MRRTGRACLAVAAATAFLLGGCGAGEQKKEDAAALRQVVLMYHNYLNENIRPPTKVEDLQPFAAENPLGYQGLKAGKYTVLWGAKLPPDPDNVVLAYEKDVPTKGGAVAMASGIVKTMTAEEFKAAPKAAQGTGTGAEKEPSTKGSR